MNIKEFFKPTIGKIAVAVLVFIVTCISTYCFVFDAPIPSYCVVTRILSIPYVILSFLIGRVAGDSWDSVMHNYLVLFTIGISYSYFMSSIITNLFVYAKNKVKSQH